MSSQTERGASLADDVLAHFGVRGMKWGVRKSAAEKTAKRTARAEKHLARSDKRWERSAGRNNAYFKVYNAAADRMNATEIARVNNKPAYKGQDFRKPSALRDKYYKEMSDTFTKELNKSSAALIGTNASGTKRVQFKDDGKHFLPDAQIVDVKKTKHADGDPDLSFKLDDNGYILSVELVNPVAHGETVAENVLEHFGVRGMKWGVRKDRGDRSAFKPKPKHEDAKKAQDAVAKIGKGRKAAGTDVLSNDELQTVVKRMNLEQQYSKLKASKPKKLDKGKKVLASVLATGATVNTAIAFANSPAGKIVKDQLVKKK